MKLECRAITAALSALAPPHHLSASMVWLGEPAPWRDSSLELERGLEVLELRADTPLPERP